MLYLLDNTCPYCGSMDDEALGGIDWELVQWDWKGETVQECSCCGKRFIIHEPAAAEAKNPRHAPSRRTLKRRRSRGRVQELKEATKIIKELVSEQEEAGDKENAARVASLVARAKQFTDRQDAKRRSLSYCGEEIPYEKFGDQVVLNDNQKDYDPEVNALIYDLHSDVRNIKHHSGWYSRGDGQLKPENN